MSTEAVSRVLHLVPPNGGGVDRFVRDLCSRRPGDWLLHVSDEQCVVEAPEHALLIPVAFDALPQLLERHGLGRASVLHAHSTVPAVRRATDLIARAMRLRYVVTLHDVDFAGSSDASDPAEQALRVAFIRATAGCTVPSGFIRDLALKVLGETFSCWVVENGTDRRALTGALAAAQHFPVAVIGAVGRHKGLDHLVEVASQLPADTGIVLLGYADGELGPGWLAGGRIWVHGAFEPERLPDLVAGYASRLAFFPKGQPESFCYALSDAWLAGLPVVAPDSGAIGQRVRAHGGGSLYDPDAPASDVALEISRQLLRPDPRFSSVEGAVRSLSSVATMVDSMNKIYAQVAEAGNAPDLDALRRSAEHHLDSRFFRRELLRLQGNLAAAVEQRDNALQELDLLAGDFGKRGDWIEQLQQGNDELRLAVENLQKVRDGFEQQHAGLLRSLDEARQETRNLQQALTHLQGEQRELTQVHLELFARHATLVRRLTLPLRVLPPSWQAWLKRLARRTLAVGDNNG